MADISRFQTVSTVPIGRICPIVELPDHLAMYQLLHKKQTLEPEFLKFFEASTAGELSTFNVYGIAYCSKYHVAFAGNATCNVPWMGTARVDNNMGIAKTFYVTSDNSSVWVSVPKLRNNNQAIQGYSRDMMQKIAELANFDSSNIYNSPLYVIDEVGSILWLVGFTETTNNVSYLSTIKYDRFLNTASVTRTNVGNYGNGFTLLYSNTFGIYFAASCGSYGGHLYIDYIRKSDNTDVRMLDASGAYTAQNTSGYRASQALAKANNQGVMYFYHVLQESAGSMDIKYFELNTNTNVVTKTNCTINLGSFTTSQLKPFDATFSMAINNWSATGAGLNCFQVTRPGGGTCVGVVMIESPTMYVRNGSKTNVPDTYFKLYIYSADSAKTTLSLSSITDLPGRCRECFALDTSYSQVLLIYDSMIQVMTWDDTNCTYVEQSRITVNTLVGGSVGYDQNGRLWIVDSRGVVSLISPNSPSRTTFNWASNNFTYQGADINTSVGVSCFDVYSNRLTTSLSLMIDTPNAVFTSTGTRTVTITSDSAADVAVPVTITGAGLVRVLSSTST